MSLYIPEINSEKPARRSGHVCASFRDNIFIWGGFNDDNDYEDFNHFSGNEYLPSSILWIYNVNSCSWRFVECHGKIPPGLSGACATSFGQTLYLFGGHCSENGHSNDVYSLDLVTCQWEFLSDCVEGRIPLPRDKFGCWTFENRIIYFGGYGPSPGLQYTGPFTVHENMKGWNGELAVLQINSNRSVEWHFPNSVKGEAPQPRAAHGMARIGKKGYLFGGRHLGCRDNDLHSFDLEKYEWSGRLPVIGPQPCGRSWHIFVPCGVSHILLHGGFDAASQELGDTWLLDVNSLTWIQTDAFDKLSSPRTRLWHTACQTKTEGEVAIFGGCSSSLFDPSPDHTNDLMFFNFSPRKLQRLCEEVVVKSEKILPHKIISALPRQISRTLIARLGVAEMNK